jgi:nitric oxide reductase large subunit
MRYARLWIGLAVVFLFSFAVLGYYGGEIYHTMPPIPKRVVTTDGKVLFTGKDIQEGQNVWQSMGGTGSRYCLGPLRLRGSRLEGHQPALYILVFK